MQEVQEYQLLDFLRKIDKDFPIHLSQKVDLEEYARKLHTKATLCTRLENDKIVGAVAGYTDNLELNIAYISLVGVCTEARHSGIASQLVREFAEICVAKKIDGVHLYTDVRNTAAIRMYMKLGFEKMYTENETRPNDLHLILKLCTQ